MIRKHFRLKKIALGLAFAAVVVPSAQATVLLDGHPAPVSYTAVAHQPIASEVSVQSPVSQLQVENDSVVLVHERQRARFLAGGRRVYGVCFVAQHARDELHYRSVIIND